MHPNSGKNPAHMGTSSKITTYSMSALLVLVAGVAQAQLTIAGNNGQDGIFAPADDIEIDLSLAVTASPGDWASTVSSGQGVYDPEQWAVIFRYESVTIPSGKTVSFKNHPSRAPVIWLVQQNASIEGTVSLNGASGHASTPAAATFAEPGPGGFRGGRGFRTGSNGSAGLGPGGGGYANSGGAGGAYNSAGSAPSGAAVGVLYGNEGVFPLVGGSGGAGSSGGNTQGGGAGGGAILIAVADTLTLNGLIRANGGTTTSCCAGSYGGAGSGGAIRLVADVVTGSGGLSAIGGSATHNGGSGRTRVEANTISLSVASVDSTGTPGTPPRLFREAADGVPVISAMELNGVTVPDDPKSFPTQDVALLGVDESDTVTLAITATYVPAGSAVTARVVRLSGAEESIAAVLDGTSGDETTWNAEIPVAGGFSAIQVHAVLP